MPPVVTNATPSPLPAAALRRRAIARALAHGGAAPVARVRYGWYRVESGSRPGTVHTVTVDATGRYRCDCEAGLAGRPCWHQASVYIAKVEHASGGRVTGPSRGVPGGHVSPRRSPARPPAGNILPFARRAA